MLGGETMTDKEKNYLLDMLYNNVNRAEVEYYNCLYSINSRVDVNTLFHALILLSDFKTKNNIFKDVLEFLNCSQFDDNNNLYNSKSQLLLNSRFISKEQDELIYTYIMFVLSNK